MMDYRENAGYIITDSCHVGDSEFVLGVHLTAPQQFVTWKCSNRTDYDWGHYFSDLFSAQKDLVARAQEEVQCLEDQRQNTIVPEAPSYSPWGNIQECETLCPGVYSVSTPGHGGIMVRRKLAEKIFRKEAMGCGFVEGGYLCFEEDCDAQVALRELMDKKMIQAPVNERFGPGAEYDEHGKRWFYELGGGYVDFISLWKLVKKYQHKGWVTVEADGTPDKLATMLLVKNFIDTKLLPIYS